MPEDSFDLADRGFLPNPKEDAEAIIDLLISKLQALLESYKITISLEKR